MIDLNVDPINILWENQVPLSLKEGNLWIGPKLDHSADSLLTKQWPTNQWCEKARPQ